MSWADNTSFHPSVKLMSYEQLIDLFGDVKGKDVAQKFGIRKERKKKNNKSESEGE